MIISLRVEQLSLQPCLNEWTFLEGLTNLKTFEAGGYGLGRVVPHRHRKLLESHHSLRAITDPRVPRYDAFVYPQNLKNLEVLKIGHNEQYCIDDSENRFCAFFKNLPNLASISFPFCSIQPDEYGVRPSYPFMGILKAVGDDIRKKSLRRQKHLKFFNFINYHEEKGMEIEVIAEMHPDLSLDFLNFCAICTRFGGGGVKLLNVNPAWYHQRVNLKAFDIPILGNPVVASLVNLHACAFTLDMPNLEKINICQTSRSNVSPTWNVARPDWPALKILELNVNSKKAWETETPNQDTALIFKFLWKDIVRGQLAELSLKFEDGKGKDGVAIPKTEDIVSGCPNLKKLRIENWPGTNKQLTKLWSGLPGLEEVSLEYCKELGNVGFVGEDVNNPVFFRLESKLTLIKYKLELFSFPLVMNF